MIEKLTPELALWVLVLLVPGFLLRYALGFFLTSKNESESRNMLTVFALSGFNFLPLLIFLAWQRKIPYVSGYLQFAVLLAMVFIWPFILALCLGFTLERDIIRRAARRLGLNPLRVHPSAWDYRFRNGEPTYVLVQLKDGGRVAGLFQDSSVAGSTPEERDLFLETTFQIMPDQKWVEKERSKGMLIKADQIASIEFIA